MTYIKQIIDQVNIVTERCGPVLLFGENIDTGSRIAGLARGLTVNPAGRILNVGDCELTHCGVGMGIMLDRGNAVLFMKQLDFLLLGLDQVVNTFNFIRAYRASDDLGSFTILLIVCDQGYQGPQSSMNSAGDVASLANVNVFCLSAASDAAEVISNHFVSPGFRVICVSQHLFGRPALDLPIEWQSSDHAIFRYRSGDDVTIACFNFALRSGVATADQLAKLGAQSDLFHVNFLPGTDMRALRESCARTGRLIVIDDSKTVTKFGDALVADLCACRIDMEVLRLMRRGCPDDGYGVAADQFAVDPDTIVDFLLESFSGALGQTL
jgi:pyruvate/2-oxoglutarate/acetoin dehydrogenase E1 component